MGAATPRSRKVGVLDVGVFVCSDRAQCLSVRASAARRSALLATSGFAGRRSGSLAKSPEGTGRFA